MSSLRPKSFLALTREAARAVGKSEGGSPRGVDLLRRDKCLVAKEKGGEHDATDRIMQKTEAEVDVSTIAVMLGKSPASDPSDDGPGVSGTLLKFDRIEEAKGLFWISGWRE